MAAEYKNFTSQNLIYRGVHARHPALAAALQGKAIPGNPNGKVTPEEHNRGGEQANSAYTSWTPNYAIARNYAQRYGPGGVILGLRTGTPQREDKWSFTWSPDEYGEDEILLRGERSGATVEVV